MSTPRLVRLAATLAAAGLAAGCSSGDPGLTCPAGQGVCGSICVDLQANAGACGACDHRCPSGATCQAGTCQCPAGQADVCGAGPGGPGQCVDWQSDEFNCGACGTSCGLGTCTAGACVCDTTPGLTVTECRDPEGVQCANLAADASNCGDCRASCATREHCVDADGDGLGSCTCVGPRDEVCPVGGGLTACIDVWSDEANCGGCGVTCGSTFTCVSGGCTCSGATPDRCPAPPATPTLCTSFSASRENCGGCGIRCPIGGSCAAAECQCPATAPTTCGATASTPGACVNTTTDRANCGGCGAACPAGATCAAGACACGAGNALCGTGAAARCYPGTGCCGANRDQPQVAHVNGLGQRFYDCDADYSYTAASAALAAKAWNPVGLDVSAMAALSCGAGCFGWQTVNICGVWCHTGSNHIGQVYVSGSLTCACGAPTGNWH
jgi:hypothetical protein